ncbi:pyridoxal-phosphate dependent enzyme [Salimicrobium halophilum]|uniref:threonine ammonia-lyase n=1 Tax=Salimicrobium halophilum TaxID=86666 RepID=A0A1G8RMT8_9BACI|nr:pyridoxal-phosphate dependent enzyme [Salimicrobium halophilum]SDJ18213.1 threonine dehydratase [Salimicrobium halophilum]
MHLQQFFRARKRIASIVEQTRCIYSEPLSKMAGANVYLKLETEQPTGAFKLRGAANKIRSLPEEEKKKGVATFSTGNHGIAVAFVAREENIPATICISNRVPKAKKHRLEEMGAEVIIVGESQDEAEEYCYSLPGVTVIPPFDDEAVIAGQGTIGLEVMEQCPQVDHVVVQLSGGGLMSGVGMVVKKMNEAIRVTGVSVEGAAVMHESITKGSPVILPEKSTLADSLLGGIGGNNTFTYQMTRQVMDESVLVTEQKIALGIKTMLDKHKMLVEGAAASGIGWILGERLARDENIVLLITGNNIDAEVLDQL